MTVVVVPNRVSSRLLLLNRNPETKDLVIHAREVVSIIDELYLRSFRASEVDTDGLPSHGAACEAIDGQYVHLTKEVGISIVEVRHGLGRVPQGAIIIYAESDPPTPMIIGDWPAVGTSVPPATSETVFFFFPGGAANGSRYVVALF